MKDVEALYDLIEALSTHGLENVLRLFYGVYQAEVTSNSDPEQRGRVQVRVVDLAHTEPMSTWVRPFFSGAAKNRGSFSVPEIGDWVLVYYENGDPSALKGYLPGGHYGASELPAEFAYVGKKPVRQGLVTRMGHTVLLDDDAPSIRVIWHRAEDSDKARTDPSLSADRTKGKSSVAEFVADGGFHLKTWNEMELTLSGSESKATLRTKSGAHLEISDDGFELKDKSGNLVRVSGGTMTVKNSGALEIKASRVTVDAAKISLGKGAFFSIPKGEIQKAWMMSHTHTTAVGPTGTPIQPIPDGMLSSTCKIE